MKQLKGFTLIELIVVIAIIGVLAAILVPTMLGYVSKSKITSANSDATGIQRAAASVLVEAADAAILYEDADYCSSGAPGGTYNADFAAGVNKYYTQLGNARWGVRVTGESAVAATYASSPNDRYVGTYPKGKTESTDAANRNIKDLLDFAVS